jgi:hypothetical protein
MSYPIDSRMGPAMAGTNAERRERGVQAGDFHDSVGHWPNCYAAEAERFDDVFVGARAKQHSRQQTWTEPNT